MSVPESQRPAVPPRGSILRIKLQNFLTYDEVEVKPAPGLNLLLGPNGTGKSTFVCALCLGLAGEPKILGRSASLPDYVKHGQLRAVIEVELSSGDASMKNPVIQTIINRNKSPQTEYYVDGKREKDKEQVRAFVRGYHIQVDNLCQFLAQDKVVEFARQSKQEILLNTEKAAGSVDLYDQHMSLKDRFTEGSQLRSDLAQVTVNKTRLEQKLAALEKPFKQYEEHQKRKHKLEMMQMKRPWIEYRQVKQETDNAKLELHQAEQEQGRQERDLRPLQAEITQADAAVRRAEHELGGQKLQVDQIKGQITANLEKLRRLTSDIRNTKNALQTKRDDHSSIMAQIRNAENDIEQLTEQMNNLHTEDVKEKLAQVERDLAVASKQLDNFEQREKDITADTKEKELEAARNQIKLNSLQNRQQQQTQNLQQFDSQVYRAYTWYLDNQEQFRGAIWLPALEMRILDKNNIKYVEACISRRDLFSFVFETFDDMQKFLGEMERQGIRVGGGEVPRENVDIDVVLPEELRRLGFRNFVSNMFEAPEGLKKYLTKLSSLNRIPVGIEAIERDLERVTNVTGNRYSTFMTPNKRVVVRESRYGGSSTTQIQPLQEPRILTRTMGDGNEEMILQMQQHQQELDNQINNLKRSLRDAADAQRKAKQNYGSLQQQKAELRLAQSGKDSFKGRIKAKETVLHRLRNELPDIAREEEACKRQLEAIIGEKFRVMRSMKLDEKCIDLAKKCVARAMCSIMVSNKKRAYEEAATALREIQAKVQKLQRDYHEKKEAVRELLAKACRAIGLARADAEAIPDNIREEFENLPDDLEELDEQTEEQNALVQNAPGVDRTIVEEYRKAKADYERATSKEEDLQGRVANWEEDVAGQRERWLTALQQLIETISRNFSRFMGVLDCAGEVELDQPENINDFTKYGVKIKVKFRDNEPLRELDQQHQSGGERSVSTMLYMLALQELSHVPFRCVDEINQGMDPINERKVFEMMTKLLGGENGVLNCTQYFMLTPKLLHNLDMGENTHVWLIHNGPKMLPDKKWSSEKFLKRRLAVNEAAMD